MKKFNKFADLPAFWETLEKPALIYEAEGEQCSVSYRQLGEKIIQQAAEIRKEDGYAEGNSSDNRFDAERSKSEHPEANLQNEKLVDNKVIALHAAATPEFIISLFANVIAGVTVLITDPRVPEQIVQATLQKAEQEYESNGDGSPWTHLKGTQTGPGRTVPVGLIQQEGRILFYTSGTSSRSRCVILTPQSLLCSAWSGQCMLPCGAEDTILCLLPLSHVFGFVCGMLWGLCYGATVALGRGVRHIFDDCLYYHPTILPAVPAIADALDRMKLFNPELRVLLVGAAPCGEALLESIRKKGIDVYFGYGLTETSSGIAITQDLDEPSAMLPCPEADIRIEEDGEISVATPCMMEGYLGEESPLVDGRLLTGDLGQLDEAGRLHITGRRKDMIVMPDGTKIFCPEYEAVLMQRLETNAIALAEFRNKAVLVVEEAEARLKTAAHEQDSERPTDAQSPGHKADALTAFQKHAEEVVRRFNSDRSRSQQISDIIYLKGKFPRTALGKLQRWKLKEILEQQRGTHNGKTNS